MQLQNRLRVVFLSLRSMEIIRAALDFKARTTCSTLFSLVEVEMEDLPSQRYFSNRVDFSTPHSMVFNTNCTIAESTGPLPCYAPPINANPTFSGYGAYGTEWLRPFENMVWGGFNVSGSVYATAVYSY